jgi:hypothetical protein
LEIARKKSAAAEKRNGDGKGEVYLLLWREVLGLVCPVLARRDRGTLLQPRRRRREEKRRRREREMVRALAGRWAMGKERRLS